eukprot:353839-Chlamydomonas_euryale.AAC.24
MSASDQWPADLSHQNSYSLCLLNVLQAARTHYCINAAVVRTGRVDEECENLIKDGFGCRFFRSKFQRGTGAPGVGVHDIEDLAAYGKRHKTCPYFAARDMAEMAELVFCPYRCVAQVARGFLT